MRKIILLVCALATVTCHQAVSQAVHKEEALLQSLPERGMVEKVSATEGQFAATRQEGIANTTFVQQVQAHGVANQASVLQVGSYNQATLQQHGVGIQATVSQYGTNNSFESSMTGANLSLVVVQEGNHNRINQQLQGSNLSYSLTQYGNNNTINQVETSAASGSYQVVQEGNNMNITIEQGRSFVPVTVRQQ